MGRTAQARDREVTAGAAELATYLYCVVGRTRAPRTTGAPEGLPHARTPRAVQAAPAIWLIVADVPLSSYGPDRLEQTLKNLDRVATLAVAHEAMVEHFARLSGVTVLPMKMFTMFSTVDRAIAEMRARQKDLQAALKRVAGCEEWGVRVTARPRQLPRAPSSRPQSGTAFLTARKQARDSVRISAHTAREAAAAAFTELSRLARESRQRDETPAGATPPLLDAAFLIEVRERAKFRSAAKRLASACSAAGTEMTFTGPWPAYNFVQPPGD
jgi:hypothetical protein